MSKLIVISGAAGSGKGTVLNRLFEMSDKFRYSVSFTTRQPRPGEIDGKNYFFVTDREFEKRINDGDFIEHVEYCGNRYGTSRSYIHSLREKGYDVILEIETVGAMNVMSSPEDKVTIFLAPPTYTVLEQRLRGRGTESEQDIQKRLTRAKQEILLAEKYDYIVVNRDGDIQNAADAILGICQDNAVESDVLIENNKKDFIQSFMNN